MNHRATIHGVAAAMIGLSLVPSPARAEMVDLCVACSAPEQTYVCRVNAPRADAGDNALQLFCVVKTAKDGGHASCAVRRETGVPCDGPVRLYTYDGPAIPQSLRSNARQAPQRPPGQDDIAIPAAPPQKGGEPETLVDMTSRAVDAGKGGVKSTGKAVGKAAGGTGRVIGKAGKSAGKQVGKGVRGAKSAARYAYDCVKSFFRNCSGSHDEAAETAPVPPPAPPSTPHAPNAPQAPR